MRLGFKIGIISVLCAFFLMSHNSSAVTINYNDYSLSRSLRLPALNCNSTAGNVSNVQKCVLPSQSNFSGSFNVTSLYINGGYDSSTFKQGDIVEIFLAVRNLNSAVDTINLLAITPVQGSRFSPLGFETISEADLQNYNFDPQTFNLYFQYDTARVYKITYVYTSTATSGTVNVGLQDPNNPLFTLRGITGNFEFSFLLFNQYRYEGSSVNKEQSEATQDASNNSQSAANNNSTSQQTTNLIGAFQSFVTALTNLNATNCNVTLAWPASLGGSMQVNICQNKDYAGNIISVFGSLTLIVFYIPFSLKLLSMIYNEIRSFTNG